MSGKSEFGKGLVVCLAKFMEHFSNGQMTQLSHRVFLSKKPKDEQEEILSGNPHPNLDYGKDKTEDFIFFINKMVPIWGSAEATISHDVTLWANGASDHLCEIKVPKGKDWKEIRKIVKELQDKGLDMGHGRGLIDGKTYTIDDINELGDLTRKALLLIDEKLGLKPDWGEW